MSHNNSPSLPVLEPLRKFPSEIATIQSRYDNQPISSYSNKDNNSIYINSLPQYDPHITYDGLGYVVGLGAIWRFPYLCYRNGGGVFLIPFFIFLFLIGIPLFFLELNLGQYTSQGTINSWRMAPIFKGLGISMCLMSFFLCVYYNMLTGYSILYLILSFRTKLDWSRCGPWSNCTDDYNRFIMRCDYENTYRDPNGRCYSWGDQGLYQIGWWNLQSRLLDRKPVLPSEEYFK
ncbi:unnamed protein product [Didymodactylos carnosus]|uniref:Transporter n=1 Tax=Didymodactylos carnosus TaxID=1234261 RepID=A0A8S2IHB6_9BILA|nr:unnamed protein product [Didymodactylos carnosus]CAF3751530.1 unnamed protein product [Didymodactylos carnosus]